ncbi:hypothetical protein J056_000048 [Wallemia ichthyophaga EXF-994]|uniref:Uncharacterized protein n=1 Tax=Wallemia ichthyophaga (strain EXF-994 / CBS 113033) TaxID=1299270 RepID=R9ARA2_WALI9|nr:uncharacterized protein J056_000048 [Wallemia ichthyophaga EXF-994]EOR04713.1 hypothetical protein J056_000048 [Wallemia ichthyophaga EXF-994]
MGIIEEKSLKDMEIIQLPREAKRLHRNIGLNSLSKPSKSRVTKALETHWAAHLSANSLITFSLPSKRLLNLTSSTTRTCFRLASTAIGGVLALPGTAIDATRK